MDILFLIMCIATVSIPVGIISYDKGWANGFRRALEITSGTDEEEAE